SDRLSLRIDAVPDRDRFDLDLAARGAADGALAKLTGVRRPLALEVRGDGSWARWRGRANGVVGNVRAVDLALANDAGRYTLSGALSPAPLLRGRLQRLTAPRIAVNGSAVFADRRLDGALRLRSAALDVDAEGVADLAANRWRNLRVKARLLRPEALFLNMTGRAVAMRAIVDGPLGRPRIDYRIAAERFAFGNTGFEDATAAGRVRLGRSPAIVPVRFAAARVTGVGEVAGGILRNLLVEGDLLVTTRTATGDGLRLRSDRLNGRVDLLIDLRTGEYQVDLNGGLDRYEIPGLGLVQVRSTLRVVPGPDRRGMRVVGEGTAQVLRLDNAFFRSLSGGLPRIVTGLERGPDGILYFRNLVLTAPTIRLAGQGYRRRDGTFHFEGSGRQARYGPLTLRLDGRIERPTLDLRFQSPAPSLGLRDVVAHLDPTPEGFAYRAEGGSRLGPFRSQGAVLLPRGGTAQVAVASLDVAGTRASGLVAILQGGFDGRLAVAGGGLSGEVLLRPAGAIQRVEAHLDARGAQLAGTTVRQGRLDLA
ncbi:MAG TPA: translocation/assembly module TamB, partial [Sphingomonas sp.]